MRRAKLQQTFGFISFYCSTALSVELDGEADNKGQVDKRGKDHGINDVVLQLSAENGVQGKAQNGHTDNKPLCGLPQDEKDYNGHSSQAQALEVKLDFGVDLEILHGSFLQDSAHKQDGT